MWAEVGADAPTQARLAVDAETRHVLGDALAQQAMSMAALAERESARRLLTMARRIDPHNPLAAELRERLAGPEHGRVAISNLLEYP